MATLREVKILPFLLIFIVTIFPYFIVNIPPIPDYIGHLYMAFNPTTNQQAYLSNFHFTYQTTYLILIFLKNIFYVPSLTSLTFLILYSLFFYFTFIKLLKYFKLSGNYLLFFSSFYPLIQYSYTFYYGNIPFMLSGIIWTCFIIYYLNHHHNLYLKDCLLLSFLIISAFFTHPFILPFFLMTFGIFIIKPIIEKKPKLFCTILLFIFELLLLSQLYYSQYGYRYQNFSLDKILIIPPDFSIVSDRITDIISNENINYFFSVGNTKPNILFFAFSLIKSFSFIAFVIFIFKNIFHYHKNNNHFYLSLLLLSITIFSLFAVFKYDNAINITRRSLNIIEPFQYGILFYYLTQILKTKFKYNPQKIIYLVTILITFTIYLAIESGRNIPLLINKTASLINSKLTPGKIYQYQVEYDTLYKKNIILALSFDPQIQRKKIFIKNEWSYDHCEFLPVIWNQKIDTINKESFSIKYSENNVELSLP